MKYTIDRKCALGYRVHGRENTMRTSTAVAGAGLVFLGLAMPHWSFFEHLRQMAGTNLETFGVVVGVGLLFTASLLEKNRR